MLKRICWLLTLLILLLPLAAVAPAAAQTDPEPVPVEIAAADGLTLIGSYFTPADHTEDSRAPAAILLHMLGSNKEAWGIGTDLIAQMLDAGYVVVAVDMRGHGATGGAQDWPLAEGDVQTWIDWLRAQPGIDPARINLVGGSIGSNLALRGMLNDEEIVTAVALSPGLNYRNVITEGIMPDLGDRPVMLVAATGDGQSISAVKSLITEARSASLLKLYTGSGHGTSLLTTETDLVPLIIYWLDSHNQ